MRRIDKNKFGYNPGEGHYGYIPDEDAPEDAAAFDLLADAERYNQDGQPPIRTWQSFEPCVLQGADRMDKIRAAGWVTLWWEIARFNKVPLWKSDQGQIGSCAGWSAANGYMQTVLYQMMLGAFQFVPINPLAMWARTKNWKTSGGQSMSAVMTGGNGYGNYPVALVGDYTTQFTDAVKNKIVAANAEAMRHQFGACRLPGRGQGQLAHQIVLCLRAGMVVCIGNNIRVLGSETDGNGMRVAQFGARPNLVRNQWRHATTLDAYIEVNGTKYLHWTNSWGDRYVQKDRLNSPKSGCWMTDKQLAQFLGGRYVDAFCIDRAEAPIDTNRDSRPATFNLIYPS